MGPPLVMFPNATCGSAPPFTMPKPIDEDEARRLIALAHMEPGTVERVLRFVEILEKLLRLKGVMWIVNERLPQYQWRTPLEILKAGDGSGLLAEVRGQIRSDA